MSIEKNQVGTIIIEKRISQWEELMKKFSEAHKEQCKTVSVDIPRAPRSIKQFPTGSQYEGTWDVLGMSGYGRYTFPNGVIYQGDFEDGMFQGKGDLIYPSGVILKGTWKKGDLIDRTLIFADGLEYSDFDWDYCKMPDRRFTIEYKNGLQPAGKSYLTAEQPTREIPPGYYDTEEGFYDPKTRVIYRSDDLSAIIRSPSSYEQKWIIENCRTNPATTVGPRLDLYETWSKPELNPETPSKLNVGTKSSYFLFYTLSQESEQDRDRNLGKAVLNKSAESNLQMKSASSQRWHNRRSIKFNPIKNPFADKPKK